MNKIREQIIELISDYMDKTLREGCLYWTIYDEPEIRKYLELPKEANEDFDVGEIIGHYDITAVLKYIEKSHKETGIIVNGDEFEIWFGQTYICNIPNKPLHLYTEQEEKDLLDLLLELSQYD